MLQYIFLHTCFKPDVYHCNYAIAQYLVTSNQFFDSQQVGLT
jgi:hypothetical protein